MAENIDQLSGSRLLEGSMSMEEALLSEDGYTAVSARFAVSTVHRGICDLINTELNRPDMDPTALLIGAADYMLQLHASLAATLINADAADTVTQLFQEVFNIKYRRHFIDTAREVHNGFPEVPA